MKKILILIDTLGGGGAEKILCNVVKNLDKNKYDITVMTIWNRNLYKDEIQKYICHKVLFKELIPGKWIGSRILNRVKFEIREILLYKINPKLIHSIYIREKYDIEIAFIEGMAAKIISGGSAKSEKYVWVHTDLTNNDYINKYYQGNYKPKNTFKKFNKIICVSNRVKQSVREKFSLEKNVLVRYNPIDVEVIRMKARESIEIKNAKKLFTIISVGRLTKVKGYDRLLEIHRRLIQEGIEHRVIVLGDGPEKEEMEQYIRFNRLEETFELLGFKENPYKYMSRSDLFICSSRAEGFSSVIAEALILGVPIISTDCAGVEELLDDGKYGVITDNTTEGIYHGLKELLVDKSKVEQYRINIQNETLNFNLNNAIEEIEVLLD